MRTPSYIIMTAVINTAVPQDKRQTLAFLVGSFLPDVPFTLLTVGYGLYYQFSISILVHVSMMEYLHFDLFFRDPVWIVSHNFFHSLVIGTILLLIGYFKRNALWGYRLLWLAIGTLLHTIVDIFTHHSDDPLILFPIDWTYRFKSPVSYWESNYHGSQFRLFEYLFDTLL